MRSHCEGSIGAAATGRPGAHWEIRGGLTQRLARGKRTHLARVDLLTAESVVVGPHVDGFAICLGVAVSLVLDVVGDLSS